MTGGVGDAAFKPVSGPGSTPPVQGGPAQATGGSTAPAGSIGALKETFIDEAKKGGSTDPVKDGTDLYNHFMNQLCVDMINQMNETKPKPPENDTNIT